MEYGFDNIFAEGPTPTPSMLAGAKKEEEEEMLNLDDHSLAGLSISNVDGMNI